MRAIAIICRRELAGYFASPLAYVFIVIFLVLAGSVTFYLGNVLDDGRAELTDFFSFHPWLYLMLIPAIGMRLWAEERKGGTIELLMTLPISTLEAVIGKFLAAWVFTGIALGLTFPLWLTVNYLGSPDNGVILASYLGSWLMAGAFLAITACVSALTSNQVIAFVIGASVCFVFVMGGLDLVQGFLRGWAPHGLVETLAGFSFLINFSAIAEGVVDLRNLIFFGSLIAVCLFINTLIVETKRGS